MAACYLSPSVHCVGVVLHQEDHTPACSRCSQELGTMLTTAGDLGQKSAAAPVTPGQQLVPCHLLHCMSNTHLRWLAGPVEGMEPQQMEQQAHHFQNEAQDHAVAHDRLSVAAQELSQKATAHMHAQVRAQTAHMRLWSRRPGRAAAARTAYSQLSSKAAGHG